MKTLKKYVVLIVAYIVFVFIITFIGLKLALYASEMMHISLDDYDVTWSEDGEHFYPNSYLGDDVHPKDGEPEDNTEAHNAITRRIAESFLGFIDETNGGEEVGLEEFEVVKVVDGDTIWVVNDSYSDPVKIRYIGIDTPESVNTDESKNTPEGKTASEFNREIIEKAKETVYLEFDKEREDEYGRTLAYVYVKTDDTSFVMVEEMLLQNGMCKVMSIEPNTKYAKHFEGLQNEAKDAQKGFWGTGFYLE